MFACPHCKQPIELAPAANVAWWNREMGSPRASLGCGTLILIGIIVAMCSGVSDRDMEVLRKDIRRLEEKVEAVAEAVKPGAGGAAVEKAVELPP